MNRYRTLFISLGIALSVMVFSQKPDGNLHIIACDVGQGDAILLVYRSVQVLIDGGTPNSGVVECLDKHTPFWDRNLELVVITHPQLDHFGGVIEVIQSRTVDAIVISSLDVVTPEYRVLKNAIGVSQAQILRPENKPTMRYGLMYLDVVWPTSSFVRTHSRMKNHGEFVDGGETRVTDEDLNNFSVVLKVRLNKFDALFTGDIGPEVTDSILATGQIDDVEYIKVPHHGSKNGLTSELLAVTHPEIAVISVGKGNSFGHPHKDILDMLNDIGVVTYRTDEDGEIEVITDGNVYRVKK